MAEFARGDGGFEYENGSNAACNVVNRHLLFGHLTVERMSSFKIGGHAH
ncbi:hypothetical protein LZA78_12765 [Sinirhodobacter sp. WL0062]|uniref:Uncharacterized protein n=1 Tax=Rhodobacter flavimaris TaxID=2907145 RepID=A0ABS8Z0E4_9RHOB|nr:hypothetical protein [Sinirhodobacter sp. WL0062]MCE5974357.1 hypothetical protein [Sinirhodobacter sp. WL0062]